MLRNYILIGLRHILRQKGNSIINLSGLALGLSVSLFIVQYIHSELQFEKEYPNYQNIYRLASGRWAKSSPPAAEAIKEYFPEINESGRLALFRGGSNIVVINGSHHPVNNGYYSDPSILRIFERKLLHGSEEDQLKRPFTIVLTSTLANTLFKDRNPVGESIIFAFGSLQNARQYEITGVIEDFPKNSHLKMEYLVSMSTFTEHYPEGWANSRTWKVTYTYVSFTRQIDYENVQSKIVEFQYDHQVTDRYTRENLDEYGDYFELQPITDIHLKSHREQEMGPNSHMRYIYIFGGLAVLIIMVASANFINIFVTQALKRSREVGIRKVTGAYRTQLITQFMLEAFLHACISTIIAILLCILALPLFNEIANQNFSYYDFLQKEYLLAILILIAGVTLLSGGYPSIFISGFKAAESIKINQLPRSSLSNARKALIVFQFIIAIFMISSTLIISDQLEFFRTKDLGFEKDHVITVGTYGDFNNEFHQRKEYVYQEMKRHPGILEVGATSNLIGNISSVEFLLPDGMEYTFGRESFMRFFRSDEGFIPTMGIELVEGRNFNPVTDSSGAFIINEKVVEMLGLDNPVGTPATNTALGTKGTIVGIMKDFNFASLHNEIEPLAICVNTNVIRYAIIRIATGARRFLVEQILDSEPHGVPVGERIGSRHCEQLIVLLDTAAETPVRGRRRKTGSGIDRRPELVPQRDIPVAAEVVQRRE